MEELLKYLDSIYPLSEELKDYLITSLKRKVLSKKEFLLKEGQVCKRIWFIRKGLLKCFYMKGGKEVCTWFMKEGDVIISVESFFQQKPSHEFIQALEDCILHYLEYNELQRIYKEFPEFNFNARVLTEQYYTLSEQRLYSLRMQKAHERYNYLMKHFPELIQRVPSKFIASYLGITLETLSRIKHVKSNNMILRG